MTTPPLIRISDETKAAARARWVEMWGEIDRAGEQMIDDILEAAAPLIAAQVLRSAALDLERRAGEFKLEPGDKVRRQTHTDIAKWLRKRSRENGRERSPCPTCSGPIRETVGMVCQTCGTDYGPGRSLTEDAP